MNTRLGVSAVTLAALALLTTAARGGCQVPAMPETQVTDRPVPIIGTWFSHKAPSHIRRVQVLEPSGASGDYRLSVTSGRSSSSCTVFGGHEVTRVGDFSIVVSIFHFSRADPNARCTRDWVTDQHLVPLGSEFQAGSEYTVTVNGDTEMVFVAR